MLRIAIYEDNTDLRMAMSMLIGGSPGFELVGAFANCLNVVAECKTLCPDVVLMDIQMPQMSGIEGVGLLKRAIPSVEIIMLTVFDDEESVFNAIRAGASGYLLKKTPPAVILNALHEVKAGGAPMTPMIARKVLGFLPQKTVEKQPNFEALSPREAEVLQTLSRGYSYKMVASELFISIDTVRGHVRQIYDKLHVHSLSEAISKVFLDK
jgi:DNA-binding NarL/FixJ family response regulator